MFRSRLFGFVAVTLCLLAFVSAHGEENSEDAEEKVKEAKKLTDEVFQTIQRKFKSAEEIKEKVESRKEKAQSAANDAQKSAGKDNAEAAIFAAKAKNELTDFLTLYEDAKQKAQEAVDQTSALLAKARDLVQKARIQISPASGSQTDFKQVSKNAAEIKNETEKWKNEITAAEGLISVANSKLWPLETHAKDAQVAKYQVDAIVKIAEIENMLKKADADIKGIEQKQKEVNATVETIKELFKNISDEVFRSINRFLNNAEGDLNSITKSVKRVKEAQEEMLKQKNYADEALKEIKQETDESKAKQKLGSINAYAIKTATSLTSISGELQSAVAHAELANSRKTSAEIEIAKHNSKLNGAEGKTAVNPQPPAKEEGTTKLFTQDTEQKEENKREQSVHNEPTQQVTQGTWQTVEDNIKQSVNNALMEPQNGEADGPVEKRAKQSVKNEPTQGVTQGTRQTVEDNQEPPVKDEPLKPLNKGTEHTAQNVPKQSVKDKIKRIVNNEVLLPSDVINDNAKTATFSLTLALIVFSALHGGYQ